MSQNQTPETVTLDKVRQMLKNLYERIDALTEEVAALKDGLAAAAATPVTAGEYAEFTADEIVMTYNDDGSPAYKAKGGLYRKYGVRIWPEVLPALGLETGQLQPGPNPVQIRVRALMGERGPRKVIGLASPV